MTLSLAAPAKLNLDLRVLAREDSGYHRIDTLFLLIDLCDRVTVESGGRGIELTVEGADVGPTEENLAYRAAEAFLETVGADVGVRIHLEKKIPAGAGLGGGSSDAAAVLRLLDRLHPGAVRDRQLLEIGAALGADVPFFLCAAPYALAWGRGGRLFTLPAPDERWVALALPDVHISTPEAYRRLSEGGLDAAGPRQIPHESVGDWDWIAAEARNDFEGTVFEEHPTLGEVRRMFEDRGGSPARMSGSGAAIFGVFADEAAARAVADDMEASGTHCVVVPTLRACHDIEASQG